MKQLDKKKTSPKKDAKEYHTPPVIPFVGYSGSGKTTLLEKVIQEFTGRGYNIGTIKHHSHDFEMDVPRKDTWRHKQAGAATTVISSPNRVGVVRDVAEELNLDDLISYVTHVDFIIVEGFKKVKRPKIEVFRSEVSKAPACKNDENLIAMVTDDTVSVNVPIFSFHDPEGIVDFIIEYFKLPSGSETKSTVSG
jgi:molybdopterin-guanine dinucleotide biosynthesis adapter protein